MIRVGILYHALAGWKSSQIISDISSISPLIVVAGWLAGLHHCHANASTCAAPGIALRGQGHGQDLFSTVRVGGSRRSRNYTASVSTGATSNIVHTVLLSYSNA